MKEWLIIAAIIVLAIAPQYLLKWWLGVAADVLRHRWRVSPHSAARGFPGNASLLRPSPRNRSASAQSSMSDASGTPVAYCSFFKKEGTNATRGTPCL